jgi:hypothetical protein
MEASEASDTRAVYARLEQLKRRTRGDRRATSLPLLTMGAITLVGALVVTAFRGASFLYWIASVPAGFGFLYLGQRRRARRTGVGEGAEPYGWLFLGSVLLFTVPFGALLLFFPLAAIAAGLLFVAWRQRNRYLAVCALVFGVVGTLQLSFATISNLLYDGADAIGLYRDHYGYFDWSEQLVVGLLAAFLLAAGLLALRLEERGS